MDAERVAWVWPNLPKNEWGPRGWRWLHSMAINYPHAPSMREAQIAFRRIWGFASHLPCAECRIHSTAFILKNPPNLASTYTLQTWVWKFHNAVNLRLGKAPVSHEEYLRAYASELCWAGLCGWGPY